VIFGFEFHYGAAMSNTKKWCFDLEN